MRLIILKDIKISAKQMNELEKQFTDFIFENTGIMPSFYIEERDYTTVPTTPDNDGDLKPTTPYLNTLTKSVHDKYGDYGVDHVVMLVHRDNWVFTGIWGTNFSNVYYKYHVHLCRFDNNNVANSLGTLYHEWMHSLDALISTHTGVEIDNLFAGEICFTDWDTTCVHGNRTVSCSATEYSYIKWKENTKALKKITPLLKQAYQVRKDLYFAPLINLQKYFISWMRSFINKKNGVSPSITKQ